MSENPQPEKQENLFYNLGLNLFLPMLFLSKGSKIPFLESLDPKIFVIIAMLLPLGYGIYFYLQHKKFNLFSVIGLLSVFAKGSIGLFELNKDWVAINEAAVPLIMGACILATVRSKNPLVKELIFNEQIIDVKKTELALIAHNTQEQFQQLLKKCTFVIAASFLLSAVMNFYVAKIFIKTNPADNLELYNAETAQMMGWSFLIIGLPTSLFTFYALWILIKGIKELTGYSFEQILKNPPPEKETGSKK